MENISSHSTDMHITTLKLPSLFAAWLFWTFHTKSHTMKALVFLSHSWSPILPLVYMEKKWNCMGLCAAFWSIFLRKKLLPDYLCKSHDHDLQWSDFIMAWLLLDKRKCEHKVDRLVFVLHFTQYMPMSSHGIGYKHTWHPPDLR